MQLTELGTAVSDLSQLLAQAIVLPFRRGSRGRPHRAGRLVPRAAGVARRLPLQVRGHLVLGAGGVADDVLVELLHLAGGRSADAVVVPAGAYAAAGAGERYRRYLRRFGMERVRTLEVSTRARADDGEASAALAAADLVLLGGGSAALLAEVLGGSACGAALQAALVRGAVVVFFGPVAEAAGELRLAADVERDGDHEGRRSATSDPLGPGLGLLPGSLVAVAPVTGGGVARVFAAALTGGVQAVVLDAGSALLVRPGWRGEVRAGTVLAVGGGPAQVGPAGVAAADHAPLGGVYTRVAPAGWRLDLAAHVVLPPGRLMGAEPRS